MGMELDYRGPERLAEDDCAERRRSGLTVTSLAFAGLTALLLVGARVAALDVWRVPSFYMNWAVWAFVEGLVYFSGGLGALFAIGGLLQTGRRRRAAVWGLVLNALFLAGILFLRLTVVNPMRRS